MGQMVMTDKINNPTLTCIEKLFDICDLLDKYPDMWKQLPDGSLGIEVSERYNFHITKAGGSE